MSTGLSRMVVQLATAVLHVWFASCRIHILGRLYHERYIRGQDKVVGATWHRAEIDVEIARQLGKNQNE